MINILVLINIKAINGVTWWRCFRPFEELRRKYRNLNFIFKDANLSMQDLRYVDLVIGYRPADPVMLSFLRLTKSVGIPIIIDCDDDLINVPINHPLYHDYRDNVGTFLEACDLADWVWVSTPDLLDVTDRHGRGEVVPNAIVPSDLPSEPSPWKGIFNWRGSAHHEADLWAHVDWYARAKGLAQQWTFKSYFPSFLEHLSNARPEPWERDTEIYFARLKRSGVNIIWKPLKKNTFNDSKSNIAWIEATMAGAVCVTNYHDFPGWEGALPDFTTDPEVVRQAWEASRDHILENYDLHTVNERRYLSIKNLANT